jgi:hypothetical protein
MTKKILLKKLNEILANQVFMLYGDDEYIEKRNYINGFSDASNIILKYYEESK